MVRALQLAASLSSRGKTVPFAAPGQTILTVGGRRVVVGGAGADRTYADWVTEANRLATEGTNSWTIASNFAAGTYQTTAGADSGTMKGSPWSGRVYGPSSVSRIIQHSLQSQAEWDIQRSLGQVIVYRQIVATAAAKVAYTRNGFTSDSDASTLNSRQCDLVIRWDDALKKAFQSNPAIGGAETEYVW